MTSPVMAVVSTYRPPSEIADLVSALAENTRVLVIDDASPCTFDQTLRSLTQIPTVRVVRFARNAGIARSLNVGLRVASTEGVPWLLTLDQDSVVAAEYPSRAIELAHEAKRAGLAVGAVGAGNIQDASGAIRYPTFTVHAGVTAFTATHEVIQSGTLWDVAAVSVFGGFREDLGMDAVDAAACLSLRERGYGVLVGPELTLHHQLGDAQQIRLLGRDVIRTGHSTQRRQAMIRNRLKLFPAEFRQSPVHAFRTVRRAAVNQMISTVT